MSPEWRNRTFFGLGLLILLLVVFRQVLLPGNALFTTDDNLGSLVMRKEMLPFAWWSGWNDSELLGFPMPLSINLTNLLLFLLPASTFNNWINAFDVYVGSFFLMIFLRMRGVNWAACALGVLTAYWLGSNFTLVYAGHIGKFGILLWVPIYLCCIETAVRLRSWRWAVLAGGAMGAMFLEQTDVALFFALVIGPYAILAWHREHGADWRGLAPLLAPLLLVALLLSIHPLISGYRSAIEGVAAVQDEDPAAKWHFITQWSWPPEESIDFIAPGYTGWRTGEPAGPYTGRMGRSEGWEQTGQGFQNFKLENQYKGAIPIGFALLAAFLLWHRRIDTAHRKETAFWLIAMLVTLLLAFGKHFPLYALFYQLPMVSSIRNPNKFLQVFQYALAISAALGFHAMLACAAQTAKDRSIHTVIRPFVIGAGLLCAALLIWGVGSMSAWDTLVARLSTQWGQHADAIAGNRIWALLHAGIMTGLFAMGLYVLAVSPRTSVKARSLFAWSLIALIAFDVLFLARHYVATFGVGSMAENDVTSRLLSEGSGTRTALISQDGFYNQWLSIHFPYHGIQTINVAQMPRMPVEYQHYLGSVGRDPLRHWQLGAVGFVIGPANVWGQIQQDPNLRDRFEIFYAYNVEPDESGVRIISASEQRPGQHVILRYLAPRHRYALIHDWEVVDSEPALLRRLSSPEFTPFEKVLLSPSAATDQLPAPSGSGLHGQVRVQHTRPGLVRLQVTAEDHAILRVADKYDPNWKATVNGDPVPVLIVDYLVKGIHLEPGVHHVELRYAPPSGTLWLQVLGMVLIAMVGGGLMKLRLAGQEL